MSTVSEFGRCETVLLNFQNGKVADGISPNENGVIPVLSLQNDFRTVTVPDDMGVGKNQTVGRKHNPGAPVIACHPIGITGNGNDGGCALLIELLQGELLPGIRLQCQVKRKLFFPTRNADFNLLIFRCSIVLAEEITEFFRKLRRFGSLVPVPRADHGSRPSCMRKNGIGNCGGNQRKNQDKRKHPYNTLAPLRGRFFGF